MHQIFVYVPGFDNYAIIGPTGSPDILAKVPGDAGYGVATHWHMCGSEHDSVGVGMRSLTVMAVELWDVAGNKIDMKGGHWSCAL